MLFCIDISQLQRPGEKTISKTKAPNLLPKMSARGIGLLPGPRYVLHLFGNPAILNGQDP
jgi:hypothetical protein